jgi:hypothetical protein
MQQHKAARRNVVRTGQNRQNGQNSVARRQTVVVQQLGEHAEQMRAQPNDATGGRSVSHVSDRRYIRQEQTEQVSSTLHLAVRGSE